MKGGKFIIYKGIKLRIYPNRKQAKQMVENFGAGRFVWNQMLDMEIKRYQNNKNAKFLNGFALNILLKSLKEKYSWLKQSDATSLQDSCETLALSYKRFFKHLAKFPRFKSRKFPKQSFKVKRVGKNIKVSSNHLLKLPKLGYIQYRGQYIKDKIKSVTLRLSSTGKFYCVLLITCENQTPYQKTNKAVGLDMGVADLAISSNGTKYQTIRFDKLLSKKKHFWETRLARRRNQAENIIATEIHNKSLVRHELSNFKNYLKAKQMVAKYNEKVANSRKDYISKLTTHLVKNYDKIVIEDLKTENLEKNHHLARVLANQSWRQLRSMLEYKCKWYGKKLIAVNPYKTSQICSYCGYDDGKHDLDIRKWTCLKCHAHLDRDINAAKNILKLGLG